MLWFWNYFGKCFESGSLNLNFFFGLMSSKGGILGSTSVVAVGWGSSHFDGVIPLDVSASLVFSALVCFLPRFFTNLWAVLIPHWIWTNFSLLFAVAFALLLVAVVAVWITLGNVVRVYPETVQGLTFYCSNIYLYITKILTCVTSVKSLLSSPKLVTSMK